MSNYSYRPELDVNKLRDIQDTRDLYNRVNNPVLSIWESLVRHIKDFESKLKENQEVMVLAASFGSSVTFYVNTIEYNQPNLIIFNGTTEDGGPTRLIQHCNQLSFLLQAVPKQDSDEKRTPIGFIHDE